MLHVFVILTLHACGFETAHMVIASELVHYFRVCIKCILLTEFGDITYDSVTRVYLSFLHYDEKAREFYATRLLIG